MDSDYLWLARELEKEIIRLISLTFNNDPNNKTKLYLKAHYSSDLIKNNVCDCVTAAITCYLAKREYNSQDCDKVYDLLLSLDGIESITSMEKEDVKALIKTLKTIR